MSTDFKEQSGVWTGWVIFAAFILFTIGCFNIIMGLAALLKDETYAVTKNGLLLTTSYTYWGWWLILVGGLLILVALGLFSGNEVSRWFAIVAVVRQPDQPVRVVPRAADVVADHDRPRRRGDLCADRGLEGRQGGAHRTDVATRPRMAP